MLYFAASPQCYSPVAINPSLDWGSFSSHSSPNSETGTRQMGALAKHDKLYFDPKFAFEVALQYEPLNIVMQRYDVTMEDLKKLRKHQPFIVAVRNHQKDIKENGLTFKLKSKMLAEELLEDSFLLAKDSNIPPAVRTKNIENIVRWGELEPAKKTGEGSDTGPQFNIQINLGD